MYYAGSATVTGSAIVVLGDCMIVTQQQLNALAGTLLDNGHDIAPWEHGDNVFVAICRWCRIPFYVTRYSGAYNAWSFSQQCTERPRMPYLKPRYSASETILGHVDPVPCAYCGNGSTLSGKGCKRCQQRDKVSLNARHHKLLPPKIQYYRDIKRLIAVERYSATDATADRLYCTCGKRCYERGIYIDIEHPDSIITRSHYDRWYQQIPLVVYNCGTFCKEVGYIPASDTRHYRKSSARIYIAR